MKITIITVVRNNKDMISDAIESVRSQTYKDTEYIVVDGASTDGTTEIVNSHLNKIDKFVSAHDNGLYDAMNKGIKWQLVILFLNSMTFMQMIPSCLRSQRIFCKLEFRCLLC